MTTGHEYSRAERVVLSLAAALVWIVAGASIAAAQFPKLPGVPKLPGQGKAKTAGKQAEKPVPVLSSISPNTLPPGGVGDLVLTGKNFFEGMQMGYGPFLTWSVKVESPERAVAQIRVRLDQPEGKCELELGYYPSEETSPSPAGTLEVFAQKAESVSFAIFNSPSSPMLVELGKYSLFPEEEINLMNSKAASQKKQEAMRGSKDQAQQMQKQMAAMNELMQKVMRGEITPQEAEAAAKKGEQNTLAIMTPEQRAEIDREKQASNKLDEMEKQEKNGELRLKEGSISFVQQQNTLFTEPVSGLKEIAVEPSPAGADQRFWNAFRMAFSDGKKYFFHVSKFPSAPQPPAADEVSKLKKHLGK